MPFVKHINTVFGRRQYGAAAKGEVSDYPLSSAAHIHWSEDGDHSLKPRVVSGRTEAQNIAEGVDAVVVFLEQL